MSKSYDFEAMRRLLFEIAEIRGGVTTAAALELSGQTGLGDQLRELGLLVEAGYENAVLGNDDEDHPMGFTRDDETGELGYFSATRGWVPRRAGVGALFRLDFNKLVLALCTRLQPVSMMNVTELVRYELWEVPDIRLPDRTKPVSLWFGRRLDNAEVWERLNETARNRPSPGLRVVLTMSQRPHAPTSRIPGHSIFPVQPLLATGALAEVDAALLSARTKLGSAGNEPISLSADGGILTVHGRTYRFGGTKQRAIVRYLFDNCLGEANACLREAVLEHAESGLTVTSLSKAFKGHPTWTEIIKEEAGFCWIEFF